MRAYLQAVGNSHRNAYLIAIFTLAGIFDLFTLRIIEISKHCSANINSAAGLEAIRAYEMIE